MGKAKGEKQKEIHSAAVKLRKLTDEQLVERVLVERSAAYRNTAAHFLEELRAAEIRGVGKVTIKKIEDFAREKGYV